MLAIDKQGCDKLIQFVFELKKQPVSFLQKKSLIQLMVLTQGFICGYNSACDYGFRKFHEVTKDGNVWTKFQAYFGEKYNTSFLYHSEVTELCGSEEKAFDLFFKELEFYLTEHGVEIPNCSRQKYYGTGYGMFVGDKQKYQEVLRIAFEIKKRPALFFREKSFTKLILYLQGFIYGYNNDGQKNETRYDLEGSCDGADSENIWTEFQKYFHKKYNTSSLYHAEVIELCGSEEKAFDLFFEELEWYLTEHGVEIPKVR